MLSNQNSSNIRKSDEKANKHLSLEHWIDGQTVLQMLHISKRTLQTLRTNGTLPYSRIGKKLFYCYEDILKILSDNYTYKKIHRNDK